MRRIVAAASCSAILAFVLVTPVAFAAEAPKMATEGAGSVDPTGSANYTIPIAAPPGTLGMAPKLALEYSSTSGNGQLGVGWGLSGLGAITRCPSIIAIDGVNRGVSVESADKYCLNGQRLVSIGTGTYGADGTEYRTDMESFTKVISNGVAGTGPSWFKVWMRNGLIMEFGNSPDSKIEATGISSIRTWAVNKVMDRQGNYYTAQYVKDASTGEFTLDRIDYTGNAAASLGVTRI